MEYANQMQELIKRWAVVLLDNLDAPIGRVQLDKAASLLVEQMKHNWLLLIDPTNHIQPLSKHA